MTKFYAAAHGVIFCGRKFLATKRTDYKNYMPGKWDVPGGTVEPGEGAEEALQREIEEETQIRADVGRVLLVYNNMSQFPERQTLQIVFMCHFTSGDVVLNPREHDTFRWVTVEEATQLDAIGFLRETLPLLPKSAS